MDKTTLSSGLIRRSVFASVLVLFLFFEGFAVAQWFEDQLPPLPPPAQYGNIMINRTSDKSDMLPVGFSHWIHRRRFTCKVCHSELEFEMKVNATDITMEKINEGQYCGACHDGKKAFDKTECQKCHNGDIKYGADKFSKLSKLPSAQYGNKIDWVAAVKKKLIKPKKTIRETVDESPVTFNKFLTLEAEWNNIPPAVFPHEIHNYWLDCSSCHPDVFNIKKKTTKHFLMKYMFEGKFCGACHLKIAFPLDDCSRCHPALKR